MKVILLRNVKGKGEKGDIIEVPDGYAQNALLPKGIAKVATTSEINKIKQAEKLHKLKINRDREHAHKILDIISGKCIVLKEKLNEKGSLYHSIGLKDITRAIYEQLTITIPEIMYTEKYALKDSGDYSLELESHDKKATFNLSIESK
jgi:large subunit ribosomal protein L9